MKAKLSFIGVTLSVLLAACGGGGGDSAPANNGGTPTGNTPAVPTPTQPPVVTTPPVVTPPPVSVTPADLQTTVAAPTYTAGSQELMFFNGLNDFRAKLGLGLLAQNTKLDAANQNHVKYLMTNQDVNFSAVDPKTGRPFFHLEDATRAGFTGVTELDRANFMQYGGVYVGESGAYGRGLGAGVALSDLIATVYHRAGLMYQFPRDVGISIANDQFQTVVMTFGYNTQGQKNASDYFGSYPADKQTNVPLAAYMETPNPMPEVALADYSTKTSFPINVVSATDTTLSVTTFTVTEAGQSSPLEVRLLTKATDPNKMLTGNIAFIVGKAPFKPNTTYNVRFDGAINGVNTVKVWSFTTGA
ncbi:hypothetical protein RCH14_004472 [Massilia sp. MP_M2]|uniref:CAP domain-containing protein n=1 Tax=Massilia sp. MP_M2 TaxID=3071713 RepID=UPI00319E263C